MFIKHNLWGIILSINTDRIKPTDCGIQTFLDDLKNLKYQITNFQREIVWDENNVKDLMKD